MFPLALRYCEVGKNVVSKFDEGILADMCEPLVPVFERCYLRIEYFGEECDGVGGWIWDPPAEAIDDNAVDAELLIANSTSFVVNCNSIAGQRKLCERYKPCLKMWNMKNLL
jgi:hypothetical protein